MSRGNRLVVNPAKGTVNRALGTFVPIQTRWPASMWPVGIALDTVWMGNGLQLITGFVKCPIVMVRVIVSVSANKLPALVTAAVPRADCIVTLNTRELTGGDGGLLARWIIPIAQCHIPKAARTLVTIAATGAIVVNETILYVADFALSLTNIKCE